MDWNNSFISPVSPNSPFSVPLWVSGCAVEVAGKYSRFPRKHSSVRSPLDFRSSTFISCLAQPVPAPGLEQSLELLDIQSEKPGGNSQSRDAQETLGAAGRIKSSLGASLSLLIALMKMARGCTPLKHTKKSSCSDAKRSVPPPCDSSVTATGQHPGEAHFL